MPLTWALECYCRYITPPFVKELMEDHHREKVLPNPIRTFGAYRGASENFSFDPYSQPRKTTMGVGIHHTWNAYHRDPRKWESGNRGGPPASGARRSWFDRCLTKGCGHTRTTKRWKTFERRMLSSKNNTKSFKMITRHTQSLRLYSSDSPSWD